MPADELPSPTGPRSDPDITDAVTAAPDLAALHRAVEVAARHLGFEHFIYGVRVPVSLTQPYHFCLNGYPPPWRRRYDERGYLRFDPIAAHAFESALPILWDEVVCSSPVQQTVMAEAREFGLVHGVSVPVYGRRGEVAMLSLARAAPALPEEASERAALRRHAHWLATVVHEAVGRVVLGADASGPRHQALTEREKDCLMWAADGRTGAEIARLLSITERTVLFHLENAGHKLGVRGRHNIIARAVSLGEIELSAHALRRVRQLPTPHESDAGGQPPRSGG